MLREIKNHKSFTVILIFFGIVFCSISLVNHYLFRTYAFDLGLYNNAIFDYAHFRLNHYSLLKESWPNPLADHFTLIPFLVSPLYWIFGSYTMLVVQVAAVLMGGVGVYRYFKDRDALGFLPEIAMLHFFCIWGIYSALSFDYHDNVIAAMIVPWFLYYFEKEEKNKYLLCFLLILVSKENMALWACFICLGLFAGFFKDKTKRNSALILSVISLVYFFGVINYAMIPLGYSEKAQQGYPHYIYSVLGNNFGESVRTVLLHPLQTFMILFYNHSAVPAYEGIKWELHTMVLLSGGFAFLFFPRYFIMLIPIYAQKLFSDDVAKWGICFHYSIEFVPILSLALFSLISRGRNPLLVFLYSGLVLGITMFATINRLDHRRSVWYSPVMVNFYNIKHYKADFNVGELNRILKTIPAEAAVSASTQLVPHLAFRESIYQFPVVNDATYIVLLENGDSYPISKDEFLKKEAEYSSSVDWEKTYAENHTVVFRKKVK